MVPRLTLPSCHSLPPPNVNVTTVTVPSHVRTHVRPPRPSRTRWTRMYTVVSLQPLPVPQLPSKSPHLSLTRTHTDAPGWVTSRGCQSPSGSRVFDTTPGFLVGKGCQQSLVPTQGPCPKSRSTEKSDRIHRRKSQKGDFKTILTQSV